MKETAKNYMREREEFENTYVRELMQNWKTRSEITPKYTIL